MSRFMHNMYIFHYTNLTFYQPHRGVFLSNNLISCQLQHYYKCSHWLLSTFLKHVAPKTSEVFCRPAHWVVTEMQLTLTQNVNCVLL